MTQEMQEAATLLLKLAEENRALKQKVTDLEQENVSIKKQAQAEKIAAAMAERGMIDSNSVSEKVASLMEEDSLEAFETAVDLMPQEVGIGTVEKTEKVASDSSEPERKYGELEMVLMKHIGVG